MTKKMLIKVTVDEALFPELYQRLDEYENPRLRAAVLRSLASDRLRFSTTGVAEAAATASMSAPRPTDRQLATQPTSSSPPVASRPIVAADDQRAVDAAKPDAISDLAHRFNIDEIADQFAGF